MPTDVTTSKELSSDLRRLRDGLDLAAPASGTPADVADLRTLNSLENLYNDFVVGNAIFPRISDTALRPITFGVLRLSGVLLRAYGMDPRDVMPDAQERPLRHAWRQARTLYRKAQRQARDPEGVHMELRLLDLLKALLFEMARSEDFEQVERPFPRRIISLYDDFQGLYERFVNDSQCQPPIRWYEPAALQAEVELLIRRVLDAIPGLPCIAMALEGTDPPHSPQRRVQSRELRDWYADVLFVCEVRERFVTEQDRAGRERYLLNFVVGLLAKLLGNSWDGEDQRQIEDRIEYLMAAADDLREGEQQWHPLVTGAEQGRLREVCINVPTALGRMLPYLTQRQTGQADQPGGE